MILEHKILALRKIFNNFSKNNFQQIWKIAVCIATTFVNWVFNSEPPLEWAEPGAIMDSPTGIFQDCSTSDYSMVRLSVGQLQPHLLISRLTQMKYHQRFHRWIDIFYHACEARGCNFYWTLVFLQGFVGSHSLHPTSTKRPHKKKENDSTICCLFTRQLTNPLLFSCLK